MRVLGNSLESRVRNSSMPHCHKQEKSLGPNLHLYSFLHVSITVCANNFSLLLYYLAGYDHPRFPVLPVVGLGTFEI